jgi:hypothetical protein
MTAHTTAQLIEERDRLNRVIAERQRNADREWEAALDDLQQKIRSYALDHRGTLTVDWRKNVEKYTLVDVTETRTVTVDMGHTDERPDWGTWFGIWTSDGHNITFGDVLPTSAMLIALIDAYLKGS